MYKIKHKASRYHNLPSEISAKPGSSYFATACTETCQWSWSLAAWIFMQQFTVTCPQAALTGPGSLKTFHCCGCMRTTCWGTKCKIVNPFSFFFHQYVEGFAWKCTALKVGLLHLQARKCSVCLKIVQAGSDRVKGCSQRIFVHLVKDHNIQCAWKLFMLGVTGLKAVPKVSLPTWWRTTWWRCLGHFSSYD